jgi:hypothetical protein
MSNELLTFTRCKHKKSELLASLQRHTKADRIIQRVYWKDGKGCAVGCSIRDFAPGEESKHSLYESLFGISEELARLEDKIFENLPVKLAKEWPIRFTEAIPEGVSLKVPLAKFKRFLLTDICKFDRAAYPKVASALDGVVALLDRRIATNEPTKEEWAAARSAAWADDSAASAAAWSAAESASAAAWSAAESARSAAWADDSAARSAAWQRIADKLIEILQEAK